jgi:hypothetical protein
MQNRLHRPGTALLLGSYRLVIGHYLAMENLLLYLFGKRVGYKPDPKPPASEAFSPTPTDFGVRRRPLQGQEVFRNGKGFRLRETHLAPHPKCEAPVVRKTSLPDKSLRERLSKSVKA